ncbi:acyl-CoA desaturase [Nibrella saemangeumensis]|uniref:Acyl-CoA desaturase n=1 Tax=Nibrella saemangeumensis TaxID=1084526 RepID=A0ABP8MN50_9BACT
MAKAPIKFLNKDKSDFFPVLKKRVDLYFKENSISKFGSQTMIYKSIIMLSLFLVPYLLILSGSFPVWAMFLLAVFMGVGTAGVGMAVMHDASHGSLSAVPQVNNLFSASLYLLGGNVYNWKIQHNTLHHTYTNIHEVDEDVTGKFLLRFSYSDRLKGYHRFQHIYAFFLYGLMTLSFLGKDFRQVFRFRNHAVAKPFSTREIVILLVTKALYIVLICVLPLLLTNLTFGQWLLGFLAMHFTSGIILSTVFQLAHIVEGVEHPAFDEQGNVENAWAIHQLYATANFNCNRMISWFIGGLDFQIEHHLFPSICHIHYRQLSKIVQATAEDFGIPYNNKASIAEALSSHIEALRNLGHVEESRSALAYANHP